MNKASKPPSREQEKCSEFEERVSRFADQAEVGRLQSNVKSLEQSTAELHEKLKNAEHEGKTRSLSTFRTTKHVLQAKQNE